jgi:hypothetical protein
MVVEFNEVEGADKAAAASATTTAQATCERTTNDTEVPRHSCMVRGCTGHVVQGGIVHAIYNPDERFSFRWSWRCVGQDFPTIGIVRDYRFIAIFKVEPKEVGEKGIQLRYRRNTYVLQHAPALLLQTEDEPDLGSFCFCDLGTVFLECSRELLKEARDSVASRPLDSRRCGTLPCRCEK